MFSEITFMLCFMRLNSLDLPSRRGEHIDFKENSGFKLNECFLPAAKEDPEWILVEKDRFVNDYDKDNDGKLNPQELLSWIVPNNQGIAQEEVCILTGLIITVWGVFSAAVF